MSIRLLACLSEATYVIGNRRNEGETRIDPPVTTLPSQSLFLLNSQFVVEQSAHFAASLGGDPASEADNGVRIRDAYRRAVGRDPLPAEVERTTLYLQAADASLGMLEPDRSKRRQRVWASFAQALFAASEFRYID